MIVYVPYQLMRVVGFPVCGARGERERHTRTRVNEKWKKKSTDQRFEKKQ